MENKIINIIFLIILTNLFALPSHATPIYDEGVSGDLPTIGSGIHLGTLTVGSSTVTGMMPGGNDKDEFTFDIGVGSVLSSIILVDWATIHTGLSFAMQLDGVEEQPGNPANIGTDILTAFWSSPVAPGTHTFALRTGSGNITNYQLDFVTTAVPEPASLTLMGLGLAGLGVTRRKRKQVI